MLENVPIGILIQLRKDHSVEFDVFRSALRHAAVSLQGEDPSQTRIKEAIQDLVEPGIARIAAELKAAERALAKKSAVPVVLGTLATSCGILVGVPIPVAFRGGLGAMLTGAAKAAGKYIEEKQEAEREDMYFAWQAVGHAPVDLT